MARYQSPWALLIAAPCCFCAISFGAKEGSTVPLKHEALPCQLCTAKLARALNELEQLKFEINTAVARIRVLEGAAAAALSTVPTIRPLEKTGFESIRIGRTQDFLGAFASFYPQPDRLKWPETLVLSPKKLTTSASQPLGLDDSLEECSEVDVIITGTHNTADKCLAIVKWEQVEPFQVTRWVKKPSKQNNTTQWQMPSNGRLFEEFFMTPIDRQRDEQRRFLKPLLDRWEHATAAVSKQIVQVMAAHPAAAAVAAASDGKDNSKKGAVLTMAINSGNIDLFANFLCSIRSKGIDPPLLLFCGDTSCVDSAVALGLPTHAVVHDKAFGPLPADSSEAYGNSEFINMMWLKVYITYTCLLTPSNFTVHEPLRLQLTARPSHGFLGSFDVLATHARVRCTFPGY
jgi:hypothetical protein